ncbi:MAG: 16S rRNA (guanine527-N7)-methyltransferase [Hyphomicrobiaceae bacterium]|jgi:16S rRNA (guanine527-N7)-methyltransferase
MKGERNALRSGAESLGLSLDENSSSTLVSLLDGVYLWNKSAGLTTIPRADAIRLHVLDSLTAVTFLRDQGTVVDLGSGGGFPGMPLAIVRTDLEFTLVESNRRRANFLAEMRRDLALTNVTVVHADVGSLEGQSFDTVISRAFRGPREFLDQASGLLTVGGEAVVMAAILEDSELRAVAEASGFDVIETCGVALPGGGEVRTLARCGLRG